jgi:hypothetical protein
MHRALERASEEKAAAAKEVQDLHEKLQVRFFFAGAPFAPVNTVIKNRKQTCNSCAAAALHMYTYTFISTCSFYITHLQFLC